ncbi:MAG: peroxiredoxin, partial [Gammaproteobacteria bacterium]
RKVAVGRKVPALCLPATTGKELCLSEMAGRNLVLYFYPKDNTPGCTTEGQEFAALYPKFRRQKTVVLGVSRDSLASHARFREKHGFPFHLLSDTEERACRLFDVLREKNLYGRKVIGVERSTFLIDAEGVLRKEWRKVKAKGHAAEVLEAVKALNKGG